MVGPDSRVHRRRGRRRRATLKPILVDLFVEQRLPVCGYSSGWSGHRLVQRMRVRRGKSWTGKEFTGTVVVKQALTWLETCDSRVMGRGVVSSSMLVRRIIAAAHLGRLGLC